MNTESEALLVDAAENALIKAVHHYILLDYNFPSEAVDCISQLFVSMELILRAYFQRKIIFKNLNKVNSFTLIETYEDWTDDEKAIVHWLREKRNIIVHKGELQWKEKNNRIEKLKINFVLVGEIYEKMDYPISNKVFSDLEISILRGEDPKWNDLAKSLIVAGNQYIEKDEPIIKDVFFGALDIAIRGFAKSWRVENTDTLSLLEIINELEEYYYGFECKYHSNDWLPEWYPYYISTYDRMNEEKNIKDIIEIDDDELRGFTRDWGSIHGLQLYLQVIEAAVMQLVFRYPALDFYECLCNSWDEIMDEMIKQHPDIEKLKLDNDAGIDVMWDAGRSVWINFSGDYSDYGWSEQHKKQLYELIESACGPIPKDLHFDLDHLKYFGRKIE